MTRSDQPVSPRDSNKPATVKDVAEAANVALSSASRVFTDHPNVSDKLRAKVLAAAEELGYEPDLVARTLRTGNSQTLGFLVADLANPISSMFISGAEDYARSHGYGLLLTNSEGNPQRDAENLQLFLRRRVDAIILLTANRGTEVEKILERSTVPIVVLDRDIPRTSKASSVYFDHAAGMKDATLHLLDHGHERIAFVGGPEFLRPVRYRLEGFREGHSLREAKIHPELIRLGSLQPSFGRNETLDLLNSDAPPTGIILGGNQLLNGLLEALHSLGLVVGTDVAIVTCDDVDLSRMYQPPISCVARDIYRAGQAVAELALEQLEEDDAPVRSLVLPTSFVARASTERQFSAASAGSR